MKTDTDADFRLARAIEQADARQHGRWNNIVSRKALYAGETYDAHIVCHPTKGFRRISKRRLHERLSVPGPQTPFRTTPRPAALACQAQLEKERAIGINPKYYATRSHRRMTGSQACWEGASKLWDQGRREDAIASVRLIGAAAA